ncbi:MAG: hypothetical protein QNJ85_10015 [Gammaproteobacteria bacterium]|nr:hypothetical protein [Gammaproteobacteria bacterium]
MPQVTPLSILMLLVMGSLWGLQVAMLKLASKPAMGRAAVRVNTRTLTMVAVAALTMVSLDAMSTHRRVYATHPQ